ncbi:uncharacterized protein E0L32_000851 [Thyridium curvatum]|uniref:Uncharacterized protein n=1 Tax=Thyridium curvatum TaxID=1093900 RepID=A0A507B1U4_9PEZI|nr:uncharacterized protein E0L32_000851 [Thyridium curvatum]TPX12674.1 hypothetical protein E0L32_000851 [Thyridium curvatum]
MKFIALIAAFLLSTPVLTAPVEAYASSLQVRKPISVFCKAKDGRRFEVKADVAKSQAQKAGRIGGKRKSGYPHSGFNQGNLPNCNKTTPILSEYPVHWVGKKGRVGKRPEGLQPASYSSLRYLL